MKTKTYEYRAVLIILVLNLLIISSSVFAQAPQKMSYQAVIRNSSNALVTSTLVGMKISILQWSPTGTIVYSETQTPSTNANGLVSLQIGAGAIISGTFASINWATGPYFIKTETDPTGNNLYTIVSTTELTSVPYALFSSSGPAGAQGPQGIQGIAGPTGPAGLTGATGPAGGWALLGNAGTIDGTNFIGTTDNVALNFRVNNLKAGRIDILLNNTFWGFQAGNSNTNGNFNTANGGGALYSNTSGAGNTATGVRALYSNITGGNNTATGLSALYSNTGGNNTATGVSALYFNTIGGNNTANGLQALYKNTTGSNNTATGFFSMYENVTGNQNTAYGLYSLLNNTSGSSNTANGMGALNFNSLGSDNTAIGYRALYTTTTGGNNTGIGNGADVPSATSSNQIRIGNTAITYAGVQVAWTITSDKRWKLDINNSNLGLDFINKLRPVSYYRNNDESKKLEYGFIAQEIEEVLNNAGASNNGIISKDDKGMYGVRYNDLMSPMVKAIQELNSNNEKQQQVNEKQQQLIETLKKEIEELKKK